MAIRIFTNREEVTTMTATKDQERKALEKIRKIVEDLGKDSYIGMAFDGCFEIAAENIDNDFGCSMKQMWVSESKRVEILVEKNRELKRRCEELEAQISDYKKQSISTNDCQKIVNLIQEKMNEFDARSGEAAARIVEYAESPDSQEFKEAVRAHRNNEASYDSYCGLRQRVIDTMNSK